MYIQTATKVDEGSSRTSVFHDPATERIVVERIERRGVGVLYTYEICDSPDEAMECFDEMQSLSQ